MIAAVLDVNVIVSGFPARRGAALARSRRRRALVRPRRPRAPPLSAVACRPGDGKDPCDRKSRHARSQGARSGRVKRLGHRRRWHGTARLVMTVDRRSQRGAGALRGRTEPRGAALERLGDAARSPALRRERFQSQHQRGDGGISFRSGTGTSRLGSLSEETPWLCVPPSRTVCLVRLPSGGT